MWTFYQTVSWLILLFSSHSSNVSFCALLRRFALLADNSFGGAGEGNGKDNRRQLPSVVGQLRIVRGGKYLELLAFPWIVFFPSIMENLEIRQRIHVDGSQLLVILNIGQINTTVDNSDLNC